MDRGLTFLAGSNSLKIQMLMDLFIINRYSLYKMLIDGLESCGLLMDYCDFFIHIH